MSDEKIRAATTREKIALREKFKDGDWVFGIGDNKGCSEVFTCYGVMQPFSYLNDYNPDNYRLATEAEIKESKIEHGHPEFNPPKATFNVPLEEAVANLETKKLILDTIDTSITKLLYYDRQEDEDLGVGDIEDAIEKEIITVDEIVSHFKSVLESGL